MRVVITSFTGKTCTEPPLKPAAVWQRACSQKRRGSSRTACLPTPRRAPSPTEPWLSQGAPCAGVALCAGGAGLGLCRLLPAVGQLSEALPSVCCGAPHPAGGPEWGSHDFTAHPATCGKTARCVSSSSSEHRDGCHSACSARLSC